MLIILLTYLEKLCFACMLRHIHADVYMCMWACMVVRGHHQVSSSVALYLIFQTGSLSQNVKKLFSARLAGQ